MLKDLWREYALCRGQDPNIWYPDQTDHQSAATAKQVCVQCPVTTSCLVWAIVHNEDRGIHGGLGEDQRRRLRRNYRQMVKGEGDIKVAGGLPRFWKLADVTVTLIRQGIEPEWIAQRNTDGATCGRIATWNRGCRCGSCHAASAAVSYMRKVLDDDIIFEILPDAVPTIIEILDDYERHPEETDFEKEAANLERLYAA